MRREQVEVEGGGDAEGIVVGRLEDRGRFAQVGAEEEGIAGGERGAEVGEHRAGCGGIEIADAGAEEEDDRAFVRGRKVRAQQRGGLAEIAADGGDGEAAG